MAVSTTSNPAHRFDAETAERYGWINRALPPEELDGFVETLARRIAALRPEQITAAKAAVGAAATSGCLPAGLGEESRALGGVYPAPDAAVERTRAAVAAPDPRGRTRPGGVAGPRRLSLARPPGALGAPTGVDTRTGLGVMLVHM
ncbi:hypothetical protein ACFW9W_42725, partial [Streptomyces sp. NPDC059468]